MIRAAFALSLSLLAGPAWAQGAPGARERAEGPTAFVGQTGHGGIVLALDGEGTVTTLRWPGATGPTQVRHRTATGADARLLPRLGAGESEGLWGALVVELDDGSRWVTALRDAGWSRHVSGDPTGGGALLLRAEHGATGIQVVEQSAAASGSDVLLRAVDVVVPGGLGVAAVEYVLYLNLSPVLSISSIDSDLAAGWDAGAEALVHIGGRDLEAIDRLAELAATDWTGDSWALGGWPTFTRALDHADVVVRVGFEGQGALPWVGRDAATPCTIAPLAGDLAGSAWPEFAGEHDGTRPFGACQVDAALRLRADVGEGGAALRFDHALSIGARDSSAARSLQEIRGEGVRAAMARSQQGDRGRGEAWRGGWWTGVIPASVEPWADVVDRALAQQQGPGGATVSSLAEQPLLRVDEPETSALADLWWALSAQDDRVRRHHSFLDAAQVRGTPDAPLGTPLWPAGAWASALDGDAAPAVGTAVSVSAAATAVTARASFARLAGSQAERRARFAGAWPAMRAGALWLAACVDAEHPEATGPSEAPYWPIFERVSAGDVPLAAFVDEQVAAGRWWALWPCAPGASGHAAVGDAAATWAALVAAAEAARTLCIEEELATFFADRAAALALAMWNLDALGEIDLAAAESLLWPAPPYTDERDVGALLAPYAGIDAGAVRLAQDVRLMQIVDGWLDENDEARSGAHVDGHHRGWRWVGMSRSAARDGFWKDAQVQRFGAAVGAWTALALDATGALGLSWSWVDGLPQPRDGHGVIAPQVALVLAWAGAFQPEQWSWADATTDPAPLCPVGAEPEWRRADPACDDGCSATGRPGTALLSLLVALSLLRRRR